MVIGAALTPGAAFRLSSAEQVVLGLDWLPRPMTHHCNKLYRNRTIRAGRVTAI